VSEDFSILVVGLRRFVTLCKTAPYRNSLTYLLTYYLLTFISLFSVSCRPILLFVHCVPFCEPNIWWRWWWASMTIWQKLFFAITYKPILLTAENIVLTECNCFVNAVSPVYVKFPDDTPSDSAFYASFHSTINKRLPSSATVSQHGRIQGTEANRCPLNSA